MKIIKLSFIFLILGFGISLSFSAGNAEINKCLSILKHKVKSQYNIDISNISVNGNNADLSIYTGSTEGKKTMSEVLVKNNNIEGCRYALKKSSSYCEENFGNVFFAKRNNIGTVKITPERRGKGYWTATEFVTWGGEVGFQFPLQKRDDPQFDDYSYYNEGDDWGQLQKNIVYVQYLTDGTLLSCGFISFDSAPGHTLNDLYQSNYYGNAFEGGSFESLNTSDSNYFGMKVKIQGLNWDNENLFSMNVLAVSYDNDSYFFNETIAHKLQIKAMVDVKNMDGDKSMNKVMDKYMDYLFNNTCFKLIHKYKSSLPGFCNDTYSDKSNLVSYNDNNLFKKYIADLFFDEVYAYQLKEEDKKQAEENLNNLPSPTRNGVSIYTWKKIESLKDEKLKNFLQMALIPGMRASLKKQLSEGKILSDDSMVFLNCPLNHDKIADNIEYIFKKYYKNGKLDLSNIEYLDPEFGDCIIPYPDKRHKDKLIENSFLKNKLAFINEKFGKEKVAEYEKKISTIKNNYAEKISNLEKQYKGFVASGNQKKAEETKNKILALYSSMDSDLISISKNDPDFQKYLSVKKTALKNVSIDSLQKTNNGKSYISYILIGLGILLVIISLFLITQKNKNEK